jgi:hypothetical protein
MEKPKYRARTKLNVAIGEFILKHPNQYDIRDIIELFKDQGATDNIVEKFVLRNPSLKELVLSSFDKQREVTKVAKRKTNQEISDEVKLDAKIHSLSGEKRVLTRKNKSLMDENKRLQKELDTHYAIKDTGKIHKIPYRRSKKNIATACAILSDTHYEEEVKPSMVGGKNKYNLDIAKKRNDTFFQKVVRLIRKERQHVEINHFVLFVLGDLITGNIHEDVSMDSCLLGPMDACLFAEDMLTSGIKFIREHEPDMKLTVVCKYGNHSRTTKFVHIQDEGAYATEKLIYSHVRNYFEDDEMINFVIEDGYHTLIDVNGTLIRAHHGHHVRYGGGVGGVTIPLNKGIAGWNSRIEFADLDLLGHFHQYMANHYDRFIINGSLIGYSPYAVAIKAKYQRPIQAFFLLDNEHGLSITIPILFSE